MATFSWRRSVTALAILTALAVAGRSSNAEEGTAESRIEAALAQPITPKEFVDTPLREVISQFAVELNIPIQFDLKAMADGTAPPDSPITITLADVSVETALALILEPLDLTVVIKHEVLLVTTATEAEGILSIQVYPVGDLLVEPDPLNPERDYDGLIDVVSTTVAPTSWEEIGGPGAIQENDFARALVVSQTRAVHREIRDLLADLRRAAMLAAGRPVPPEENTAERRIEEALAQKITPKDFVNTPLREVMSQFAGELKVPIYFDKKAMADGDATPETIVNINVADVSVESALALILEPLDLTVVIKHEVLLITTTTDAENVVSAEVYPVDDQLFAENARDYEDLIELITTTVAPTSWPEGTGPGPIKECDVARALVLPQTRVIHRQIRDLLAKLRAAAVSGPVEAIAAAETVLDDGQPYVRVYRIGIPRFDVLGGGFSGSGGMGGGTMGAGRMGGSGRGGGFSVTQTSVASNQPGQPSASPQPPEDLVAKQAVVDKRASELAAAIPEFVEPATWESAGGTGRIQAAAGALIVRQTRDVHLKIMEFLSSFW